MAGQFCENCGAPLVPGNKFCESCGNPVASTGSVSGRTAQSVMVMCPSCGVANQPGTMFCTGCGMPIDDEAYDIYAQPQVGMGTGVTQPPEGGWGRTPQTYYPSHHSDPVQKPSVLPYVLAGIAVAIAVAGGGLFLMRDRIFGGSSTETQEEVVDDSTDGADDSDKDDADTTDSGTTSDDEDAEAEAEAEAQRKAEEEEAQRKAEEEAQKKAEEEAQRKAEEEAAAAAAAAAQADQSFHDTLVSYYTKLPGYDSRIKGVASTWNADHFYDRDSKSQTAYGLESEIYNDYIAVSSLTVPSGSAWSSQHSLLVQTYEAAYGRIHTMCESWRINMQYSDPENHQSEINYPIVSQNDANGINYDKKRYDSLYPQINL